MTSFAARALSALLWALVVGVVSVAIAGFFG